MIIELHGIRYIFLALFVSMAAVFFSVLLGSWFQTGLILLIAFILNSLIATKVEVTIDKK